MLHLLLVRCIFVTLLDSSVSFLSIQQSVLYLDIVQVLNTWYENESQSLQVTNRLLQGSH